MENLRFLLYEVHQVNEVFSLSRFSDYDRSSADIILDSAKDWADKEFYPYFQEMDAQPAVFDNGRVKSHPQLINIFKQAGANGWIGPYFEKEHGGMQMPFVLSNSINHILEAANNHIPGYLGLTAGAAHLIAHFGNENLRNKFIPNMLSGKWGGTMCLTEPQAGSSLSDIKTKAILQEDGTYKITGQKIFISGGDHEAVDNFVHLTLVRIEGAPEGTKGISLMAIPRLRQSDSGLSFNDVQTASDFQKMGQRGYSTVHLTFGEDNDCIGYIVGEPNMGLKYMFQMMNGARIDVGMTATSIATAAFYASLKYAKERPQGRRISNNGKKDVSSDQTLIINHADVRRMLLLQKAITEGSLSLLIEASKCHDMSHSDDDISNKENRLLLELLTPIAKTYPSEKGKTSVDNGLQILGGYGFCSDFVLQQYYRDIRIMSLYEGTTGIQSLDLLGRKVTMKNGAALQILLKRINDVIEQSSHHEKLKAYGVQLTQAVTKIQEVLSKLIPLALSGKYEVFLSDANQFMEMASTTVIAYQWLKMATRAEDILNDGNLEFDKQYYENKITTMKFFFKYELPKINANFTTLMNDEMLTIQTEENSAQIFN